jgi:hypothetical protein
MESPYHRAQKSPVELKAAIYSVLDEGPEKGLQNVEIGRILAFTRGIGTRGSHLPDAACHDGKRRGCRTG